VISVPIAAEDDSRAPPHLPISPSLHTLSPPADIPCIRSAPPGRIIDMSHSGKSIDRFSLYCNVDGSCSVKRVGDEAPAHLCPNLVEAVGMAQDLKSEAAIQMTVYDPAGKVLLQSFA
jgi:hypothetical protein